MPETVPDLREPPIPEETADAGDARTPEPADRELVRQMASGDRAALALLYDRYAGLMLGIGVRMLCEKREAEDLVHDVLLEAWHKAADYEEARGTVRAWLFLRMRSRCLDRIKAVRERLLKSQAELEASLAAATPEDDAPGGPLEAERLRRAVVRLPVEQRLVLELSYFRGLSGTEIAGLLGVPLGTVKSRVASALCKLRQALGAPDPREKDRRRSA